MRDKNEKHFKIETIFAYNLNKLLQNEGIEYLALNKYLVKLSIFIDDLPSRKGRPRSVFGGTG